MPGHTKYELVLLRGNSALPRGVFTETQKPSQRVTELRQFADALQAAVPRPS